MAALSRFVKQTTEVLCECTTTTERFGILKMEFPENIPGNILDEIALEGLEGVTISSV
jgi:hypothetical protein